MSEQEETTNATTLKRDWVDDWNTLIKEVAREVIVEEMTKHEQRIRQNILDDLRKEMRLKTGRRAE